ncbi:hypothetical protein [uncultured Endozoicomonas sp.]|uniref:hypothetical protein n=1 Tax=uncultured Endozoicomonas sp. TaxID=432652 RepID=UPI0026249DE8|nr:hypothetical protein [uncultured Endozoicomonas sp.]
MQYSRKQQIVINRVISLFTDVKISTEAWGFYLFDQEFEKEQELRNRLGLIWISSLFDLIATETTAIAKHRKDAVDLGLKHIDEYCNQAEHLIELLKDIIEKFSVTEQLFILNLRNQYVHSYLVGRHNDSITIKFLENRKIVKRAMDHQEYHDMLLPLFEAGNLDETVQNIICRIDHQNDKFFKFLAELQQRNQELHSSINNGQQFTFITLRT